ncbi:MAG: hypothetical protein BWY76_01767 [bacterium ADurb.Bin429]|nr:MAG: hypothetical protein BWY76_01767 [bacterium ADurb.Bin429]
MVHRDQHAEDHLRQQQDEDHQVHGRCHRLHPRGHQPPRQEDHQAGNTDDTQRDPNAFHRQQRPRIREQYAPWPWGNERNEMRQEDQQDTDMPGSGPPAQLAAFEKLRGE